ncbi:MAG: hypothetical protein AABW64_01065 [Nanoarchaeota archaeon]
MASAHKPSAQERENKRAFLKEMYPHLWNLYNFHHNENKAYDTRFSFVLALTSVYSLLFFQLFRDHFMNKGYRLLFIPFFFFVLTTLLLFLQSIPRIIWSPRLKKEQLMEIYRDKKDFYEMMAKEIFSAIPHLQAYKQQKKHFLLFCLSLLSLGYVSILFVAWWYSYRSTWLTVMMIPAALLLIAFIYKLSKKTYLKKQVTPEVEAFFDQWMEEKK